MELERIEILRGASVDSNRDWHACDGRDAHQNPLEVLAPLQLGIGARTAYA